MPTRIHKQCLNTPVLRRPDQHQFATKLVLSIGASHLNPKACRCEEVVCDCQTLPWWWTSSESGNLTVRQIRSHSQKCGWQWWVMTWKRRIEFKLLNLHDCRTCLGFMVVRNLKNRIDTLSKKLSTLRDIARSLSYYWFPVSHAFMSYLTPNSLRFQEKNYKNEIKSSRNITRLSSSPTFLIVLLGLPTLRVQGVGRGAASCQTYPFQPFFAHSISECFLTPTQTNILQTFSAQLPCLCRGGASIASHPEGFAWGHS